MKVRWRHKTSICSNDQSECKQKYGFVIKHKTNNKNMVLFAMMVIYGNGDSHVVAAFLAQDESKVCLRAMVKLFKDNNPEWKSTEVIITDKDTTERQVLREEFRNCHLQIFMF